MKKPNDPNKFAKGIIDAISGDADKDPNAVALGRKGGLKGGRARANSLTRERRSEIAKKGAAARWGKKK